MEGGLDTVIMLFRRDLRVYDNPALLAALQAAKSVVCSRGCCFTAHTRLDSSHPSCSAALRI